jgi:hypothetical protein
MQRGERRLVAALAIASLASFGCQASPGPGSAADVSHPVPPESADSCALVTYQEGLHFLTLEKHALFGQTQKSFLFPILGHSAVAGAGAGISSETPRAGERYVAFDGEGWLGVAQVTSDCGDIPCQDCATTRYCSARWIARSTRGTRAGRVDAIGPTNERWVTMRVVDLRSAPPPCPQGLLCDDHTPRRPEYIGWKTLLMLDLDADGRVDVAARLRSNCGPAGRSAAEEIQVQGQNGWRVVERSNLGYSTWLDDGRDVEVPGDVSFPPNMP